MEDGSLINPYMLTWHKRILDFLTMFYQIWRPFLFITRIRIVGTDGMFDSIVSTAACYIFYYVIICGLCSCVWRKQINGYIEYLPPNPSLTSNLRSSDGDGQDCSLLTHWDSKFSRNATGALSAHWPSPEFCSEDRYTHAWMHALI